MGFRTRIIRAIPETERMVRVSMSPKKILTTLMKFALVGLLLWWMVRGGRLNATSLAIFIQNVPYLLLSVAFWLAIPVGLGSFRWFKLLRGAKVQVGFLRALQLQMVGLFFNTAMPGAVSGDLVKAVYVVRDQRGQRRTSAALAIILDRVVGLMGLFTVAGVASIFYLRSLRSNPVLIPMAWLVFASWMGMLSFLTVVFYPHKTGRDPIERLLNKKPWLLRRVFALVLKVYQALRAYRDHPRELLIAWGVSVVIQAVGVAYYWYTTVELTGQVPDFSQFVIVLPFGMIATVIPIAPGGLGVGHVAFDKLFTLIGLNGGANVFNVIALGQLLLNLTGIVPYLFMRRKGEPAGITEDELRHAVP
ncbi:UPF0104 family protein [bacterium]|nr:UPF0104 family protein [bacterium]